MRRTIIVLFSILLLAGCEEKPMLEVFNGEAQGTTYSVQYWSEIPIDRNKLKKSIDTELMRIDKLMSNYRSDSAIEAFNQNQVANIPIKIDKEILAVLDKSEVIYEKSHRCYDPTIKPLFKIWGFAGDRLTIPDDQTLESVLQSIGFDKLRRDTKSIIKTTPKLTIDLSAIGQGYAITQIATFLKSKKVDNFLVEIGGEMLVAGTKPNGELWRVGVERPIPNSQKINEVIVLQGKKSTAIMTSGTYRHYYDDNDNKYSHILDPRTGKPIAHNSVAVTVLMSDATDADAWSTALLCLGSDDGLRVANQENIPAIYYDLIDGELSRKVSKSLLKGSENWEIKDD